MSSNKIHLIPKVKKLEEGSGFLKTKSVFYDESLSDPRLRNALAAFKFDAAGTKVDICIGDSGTEEYELYINEYNIRIVAGSNAGAFYAIQTLRQLFKHEQVPCLHISDKPDFEYRGFYHDVTRGKVPTVESLKKLIDYMAYYKLNSLQLYVEHTFEFKECEELNEKTGYLTKQEIQEIDRYCRDNFIEFIPSIATFGHMYEILQQEKYQHLRVLNDFDEIENFWHSRMQHHTIDPLQEESMELVKSLIDQYAPNFKSEFFNICCDETFDLKRYAAEGQDEGKLYVDFVKKIIDCVTSKNKKIMMWADILLQHPECIDELPEDTYFLNWYYDPDPKEADIKRFSELGRRQIVCPGTTTWNRFCENVAVEEPNISLMAEYGYRHGAVGLLNTNWGDWGNPCSIELALYGLVLGAEKSWSVATATDEEFYNAVNHLLYENENGIQYLREASELHSHVNWMTFIKNYFSVRYENRENFEPIDSEVLKKVQNGYLAFAEKLSKENWAQDEFRKELLLCVEGVCVIAELSAKLSGHEETRVTDTKNWLNKYRQHWTAKNKESELSLIEEVFLYCENV